MAFINHGLITRFLDLLLQSIICSSWHFPFRVATTRITPSSSFQGLGQKTKQDLLKEESEKMKVFAQQLRSKPQFIAVFKVCNIISSDNRQQVKSKPSVHCCLQGGPAWEFPTFESLFCLFQAFSNFRLLTFMIVAWIMGVGMGLIFTFLFWHLQVGKTWSGGFPTHPSGSGNLTRDKLGQFAFFWSVSQC